MCIVKFYFYEFYTFIIRIINNFLLFELLADIIGEQRQANVNLVFTWFHSDCQIPFPVLCVYSIV